MRAVGYQQAHTIEDLNLQDITLPAPTARGHDLLVAVKAIAMNPIDTKVRKRQSAAVGDYQILGWDAVGIVQAVGDQASLFKPGDRVWYAGDLTRPGSNAELQCVDERLVGLAPSSLSDAQAAALPLTTITAWEMLFDRLQLPRSSPAAKPRLLIVGAGGGVGSIMVQLAAKLTDADVIATASRQQTADWLKQLGAHHVIDHAQPLSQEFTRLGLGQVTHAVSLNATDQHYPEIVECLAPQGKFGLIDDPMQLDISLMKRKSLSLHWELMFTRSLFQTDDMIAQHQLLTEVAQLVDQGLLVSTMSEHFGSINAANISRAHQLLESLQARGKIVLEGFD